MKSFRAMLMLIPCVLFLNSGTIGSAKVVALYKRVVFEQAMSWLKIEDLEEMYARGKENPEAIFELRDGGESEREPIRQGLRQLRILAASTLSESVPEILKLFENNISALKRQSVTQENSIVARSEIKYLRHSIDDVVDISVPSSQICNDRFLVVKKREIQVWSSSEKKIVQTIPSNQDLSNAVLVDAGRQVAIKASSNIILYDLANQAWKPVHSSYDLVASPDGKYLMVQMESWGEIVVRNIKAEKKIRIANEPTRPARQAWFLPDNTLVVYSGNELHYYNSETGEPVNTVLHSALDRRPLVVPGDKPLWIYNMGSHDFSIIDAFSAAVLSGPVEFDKIISHRDFAPDYKSVLLAFDSEIHRWDIATKKLTKLFETGSSDKVFHDFKFTPDQKFAFTVEHDRTLDLFSIVLWDVHSASKIAMLDQTKSNYVKFILSPDGGSLTALTFDHVASVWSLSEVLSETVGRAP